MLGLDGQSRLPGGGRLSSGPWRMGKVECRQEEVLLAKMMKVSHEWRQERTRWYWKEIT